MILRRYGDLLVSFAVLAGVLTGRAQVVSQATTPSKQGPAEERSGKTAARRVRENPKDALQYAWVPPGTFMMGCSPGDNECGAEEKPAHRVTLTKGFWIGKTEVTVGAYKRFTREAGREMPPSPGSSTGWNDDAMPMVNVSWDDSKTYCTWVQGRLPTEAEWEYAARGGSAEARYGPLDQVAWYAGNSGQKRLDSDRIWKEDQQDYAKQIRENADQPHKVGLKSPNGFGLLDMLGNVWEWVNDWYGDDTYASGPATDPLGAPADHYRVLRGGSWYEPGSYIRVSARYSSGPSGKAFNVGFRCVWEADAP